MKTIAAMLLLGASVSCAEISGPQLRVDLKKAEDLVAITSSQNTTIVTITSKSGIGSANLVRTGTRWPPRVILRLTVKGLEFLRAENEIIQFETSLKSPKQVPYWKVIRNGSHPITPDGTLDVVIVKREESVDVIVPGEMMEGNSKKITFTWIDFFR